MIIAIVATLAFVIASLSTALVLLWWRSWVGTGDLDAFLWWSLPLAVGVFFSSRALSIFFANRPLWQRYTLAALAGPSLGYIWTLLIQLLLGSTFGAFDFSVYYAWVTGSLSALLVGVVARVPRSWPIGLGIFIVISSLVAVEVMMHESRPAPPDIVVMFKPGTTLEEVSQFSSTVVGSASRTGRGYELPEIVSGAGNLGTESFTISFWRGTTDAERDRLRKRIQKSPLVHKIIDQEPDVVNSK